MMLTVLTVAGIVGALLAVYVLSTKPQVSEALTGQTTFANTLPDAEILRMVCHGQPHPQNDWRMTTFYALHDAEQMLDRLENQGFTERELIVMGHSQFAVRWK